MSANVTLQSLNDKLSTMSRALLQAKHIVSSLQELHEAEMRQAISDLNAKIQKLEQQLANSNVSGALPNQISEADSTPLRLLAQHGKPQELLESVSNDISVAPGRASVLAVAPADLPAPCAPETKPPELEPVDEQANRFLLPSRAQTMREVGSGVTPQATLRSSRTSQNSLDSDAYAFQVVSQARSLAQATSIRGSETMAVAELSLKPSSPAMVRKVWNDAQEESVTLVQSRCNFEIVNAGLGGMHLRKGTFMSFVLENISMPTRCGLCMYGWLCGIMHPVGPIRFFWNGMSLIFIGYDLFAVPMQAFKIEDVKALQVFEWILTIWWSCDILMTFKTGYIVGSRAEMRPRKIAIHYFKTWLFVDLVIATLEWVNRFAVALGSASLLRSSRAFRTLRFMKLFRVTKMREFWRLLQDQINSNVLHLLITMTMLGCVLLLTMHISSCVWYAVGDSRDDGWTSYERYDGNKNTLFWYIASFRWTVSQFNGRTDMDDRRNMVERFFTCTVGIICAIIVKAMAISIITKTMLDLNEIVSAATRRQRVVNSYLEANPLPPMLRLQVKRCLHDYQDVDQEMQREQQVLEILPRHIQIDVMYEVRSPVLMRHHFFNALRYESPLAMRLLCRKVVACVSASKDEVVFDKGDVCDRILFTDKLTGLYGEPADGRVEVPGNEDFLQTLRTLNVGYTGTRKKSKTACHPDLLEYGIGPQPRVVSAGRWISEAALWVDWQNKGRFVSDAHGVLLGITASRLGQTTKSHPDLHAMACVYAKTLTKELFHRGSADSSQLSDILSFEVVMHSPLCLAVTIESARRLRSGDFSRQIDPYCLCKVVGLSGKSSEARIKTEAIENSLDPVWNHTAEVILSRYQLLEFTVLDYFDGKSDTDLGSARLKSDDFYPHGFEGDLHLVSHEHTGQGSVRVKIKVMDMERENQGPQGSESLLGFRYTTATQRGALLE